MTPRLVRAEASSGPARSYLLSAPRLVVMMWAREALRRARLGPQHPGLWPYLVIAFGHPVAMGQPAASAWSWRRISRSLIASTALKYSRSARSPEG
jgi:hypothetical protein